jgi:hypothetical protein
LGYDPFISTGSALQVYDPFVDLALDELRNRFALMPLDFFSNTLSELRLMRLSLGQITHDFDDTLPLLRQIRSSNDEIASNTTDMQSTLENIDTKIDAVVEEQTAQTTVLRELLTSSQAIEKSVTGLATSLEQVPTTLDNIANTLTELSGAVDGISAGVDLANTNLKAIQGVLETIQESTTSILTACEAIETISNAIETQLGEVYTAVFDLAAPISESLVQLRAISGNIIAIRGTTTSILTSTEAMEKSLLAIETTTGTIETSVTAAEASLATIVTETTASAASLVTIATETAASAASLLTVVTETTAAAATLVEIGTSCAAIAISTASSAAQAIAFEAQWSLFYSAAVGTGIVVPGSGLNVELVSVKDAAIDDLEAGAFEVVVGEQPVKVTFDQGQPITVSGTVAVDGISVAKSTGGKITLTGTANGNAGLLDTSALSTIHNTPLPVTFDATTPINVTGTVHVDNLLNPMPVTGTVGVTGNVSVSGPVTIVGTPTVRVVNGPNQPVPVEVNETVLVKVTNETPIHVDVDNQIIVSDILHPADVNIHGALARDNTITGQWLPIAAPEYGFTTTNDPTAVALATATCGTVEVSGVKTTIASYPVMRVTGATTTALVTHQI